MCIDSNGSTITFNLCFTHSADYELTTDQTPNLKLVRAPSPPIYTAHLQIYDLIPPLVKISAITI